MFPYSPAGWRWPVVSPVAVDDRCVNEGGTRNDGSVCGDRAEENGWCGACWAELAPTPP